MKTIFITGDRFEVDSCYHEEKQKFFGEDPQDIVEAEDFDQTHAALASSSLFCDKKRLVHLDSALFNSKWCSFILRFASNLKRNDRIMVIRDVGESLDRRKVSKLKKVEDIRFEHFGPLKNSHAAFNFAMSYCKRNEIKNETQALRTLVNVVGKDRGLIASEINKLASSGKKITERFVLDCSFPSSTESAHFILYSAIGDGNLDSAREQARLMINEGIPALSILASIVKLISTTIAGPERYKSSQNEYNKHWMGDHGSKKISAFMAENYQKIFARMGKERILNTIALATDSLPALRLSGNLELEKERVDRIVGEICRE